MEITIIELLASFYKFLRKYIIIILLFTIIGFLIAFFKYRQNKSEYYESTIYASTGLLYSPRGYEPYINALYTDLITISDKISDPRWVKTFFNQDSTKFISLKIIIEQNLYRYNLSPIKITLETQSYNDFDKFKQGLVYYYQHHSPLLELYKTQIQVKNKLDQNIFYDAIKSTKSLLNNKELGFLFSANLYDSYVLANIVLARPLLYFTSDFTNIQKTIKRSNKILLYTIIFFALGLLISIFIELTIQTHKFLKQEKNEE